MTRELLFREKISDAAMEQKYPFIIAHEYKRYYNLIDNNQITGAYFELKDIFEVLLKLPTLIAVAYLESTDNEHDEYNEILKMFVQRPISLGDWKRIAHRIQRQRLVQNQLPSIHILLKKICKLYERQQIVNWRNNMIGHGALPFDTNEQFKNYMTNLTLAMNDYLFDVMNEYENVDLLINQDLIRDKNQIIDVNKQIQLTAKVDGKSFDLVPFIVIKDNNFYLYDSLNKIKLSTFLLDYMDGTKSVFKIPFFAQKYRRFHLETSDSAATQSVVTAFDNDLLNHLNRVEIYQKYEPLYDWFNKQLDEKSKGIFLISMDRGMGKTSFVGSIDGMLNRNHVRDDALIRAYYINKQQYRGIADFINTTNTVFWDAPDRGQQLREEETPFPRISLTSSTIQQDFAKLLNKFAEIHYDLSSDVEKLIYFIDGVDEIYHNNQVEGKTILDYIPRMDQIEDNVYIFITCRNEDSQPLPEHVKHWINRRQFSEEINLSASSDGNVDQLKKFINRAKSPAGSLTDKQKERILEKGHYRFLEVKLWLDLLSVNEDKEKVLNSDKDVLTDYFNYLKENYGSKLSRLAVEILMIIATSYEPLSLLEINELLGGGELTVTVISILKDIEGLLIYRRTRTETVIQISNVFVKEYLIEHYSGVINRIVDRWIDSLRSFIESDNEDIEKYTTDFVLRYRFAYILHYIKDYNDDYLMSDQYKQICNETFLKGLFEFEKEIDSREIGIQAVLQDVEMATSCIELCENGLSDQQSILGGSYNNRGFHQAIHLGEVEKGIEDLLIAERIFQEMEQSEFNLDMLGKINSNLACAYRNIGKEAETTDRQKQTYDIRKQLVEISFDRNAERFLHTIVEHVYINVCHHNKGEASRLYSIGIDLYKKINDRILDVYNKNQFYLNKEYKRRVNFSAGYSFVQLMRSYSKICDTTKESIDMFDKAIKELKQISQDTESYYLLDLLWKLYYEKSLCYKDEEFSNERIEVLANAVDILEQLINVDKLTVSIPSILTYYNYYQYATLEKEDQFYFLNRAKTGCDKLYYSVNSNQQKVLDQIQDEYNRRKE